MATQVSIGKKPDPVSLTDTAVAKVAELLAEEDRPAVSDGEAVERGGRDVLALRVAVRPGGCSGYSYDMFFDTEVEDDDVVREYGPVKVVVDAESAALLVGSTLDYADGLQGAGFHITNPNATRTCGCGSSFS